MGLCLDRGPEMITAILAVWLAGAAYLPLDPGYPAGRLAQMLAGSGAGLLVTRGPAAAAAPGHGGPGRPGGRRRDGAQPAAARPSAAVPGGWRT